MAQLILNIPDIVFSRVITALCAGTKNLITPDNAKQQLITIIITIVQQYESDQAVINIRTSAINKVTSDIQIT